MVVKQNLEWVERVTVNLLASRLDSIESTEVFDSCVLITGVKKGKRKCYRVNNAGKVTRVYERFVGRAIKPVVVVR